MLMGGQRLLYMIATACFIAVFMSQTSDELIY